jgi:hypothetical protein
MKLTKSFSYEFDGSLIILMVCLGNLTSLIWTSAFSKPFNIRNEAKESQESASRSYIVCYRLACNYLLLLKACENELLMLRNNNQRQYCHVSSHVYRAQEFLAESSSSLHESCSISN